MVYDEKFRRKVIAYKDSGHTFAELLKEFAVHSNRYYAWKKELEETGTFAYRQYTGKIDPKKLAALVKEHPDWRLSDFAAVFNVCPPSVQQRLKRMGITRTRSTRRGVWGAA